MCALKVQGSWLYYNMVQRALPKICPGAQVDGADLLNKPPIAGSGEVSLGPNSCDKYCCHRAGCNLLSDLVDPTNPTITIKPGTSAYTELSHPLEANRGVVWWTGDPDAVRAPDCCPSCGDKCCTLHLEPEVELAHELVHAWHDAVMGTYMFGTPEEQCTVCGENQLRREMGYLRRCTYFDEKIGCDAEDIKLLADDYGYDCKTLDQSSKRSECDCCPDAAPDESEDDTSDLVRVLGPSLKTTTMAWFRMQWLAEFLKRLGWPFGPKGPKLMTDAQEFSALEKCGFGGLLTGVESVDAAVEAGARVLVAKRPDSSYPELMQLFDGAAHAALLEIVLLAGSYRVMLLTADAGGARLVTNIRLRRIDEAEVALGAETAQLAYALPADLVDTISEVLRQSVSLGPPQDSMGGVHKMSDGAVHFLKVKSDQTIRTTILRGYEYDGVVAGGELVRPEGEDGPKWDAIKQVVDLGVRQMRLVRTAGIGGVPVQDVSPGPNGGA